MSGPDEKPLKNGAVGRPNLDRVVLGCVLAFTLSGCLGVNRAQRHCPASPLSDLLPSIVAPVAGENPIWLADGSFGSWIGEGHLVKSLWVLSRAASGAFIVTGRRLGDGKPLRFQRAPGESLRERLVVADPIKESALPGVLLKTY